MIIASPTRLQIDQLYHTANLAILLIGICLLCGGLFLILVPRAEDLSNGSDLLETRREDFAKKYDAIGTGPLSLRAYYYSRYIPDLGQEILVLARNTRPDRIGADVPLLIGLKSSKQEQVMTSGQTLFLEMKQEDACKGTELHFSSDPTPFWVKPLVLDRSSLLIEAGIQIKEEGSPTVLEERAQFVLKDVAAAISQHQKELKKQEPQYFKALKSAKVWGVDALLVNYGGEDYRSVQDKYKIELSDSSSPYVCFVGAGDYLSWDGGKWQPVALKDAPRDKPLAAIKSVHAKGVEMEAWDETGFYPLALKLDLARPAKGGGKPENMPTSIRIRSSSQVTCLFGKKRVILKKGDWLLKTPSGWRKLKRLDEIEDCIQHRLRGELFVFDGVEKEKEGLQLKGHFFDEMRTNMIPVCIPIAAEKKEGKGAKKERKVFLRKKTAVMPILLSHHMGGMP